jgi:hypothetical protein
VGFDTQRGPGTNPLQILEDDYVYLALESGVA